VLLSTISAALLTGQLFFLKLLIMNRCVNSGCKVKTQPAAIARCLTVQDVIHTIRWTRINPPSPVRGAGHDFRTIAVWGAVIDLSQMKAVTVDPNKRTAQIQAGATAGDPIEATQKYGLASYRNHLQRWYDLD